MYNNKIAIIGAGAMGGAVARGLVKTGFPASAITVANPHTQKLKPLEQTGINITTDNIAAIAGADLVIFAVKPWILPQVVQQVKPHLNYPQQQVAAIVASVTDRDLRDMFEKNSTLPVSLSLVMPNTAMELGESMTFVVSVEGDPLTTISVFEPLGRVMVVNQRQLGAATALASCGVAYALRYAHAAMQGGVELGMSAADSMQCVAQTLRGVAELLSQPGAHPETEIDKVTTPGGLTIRGLNEMEKYGFSASVIAGLKASIPS